MDEDIALSPEALQLHLEGFEGPLDLLLDLARRQRVDLAKISIVTLVDQYVAAVSAADRVNLPRAVEWLVMAAWLTWLKSRLLLPKEMEGSDEAEQAAESWPIAWPTSSASGALPTGLRRDRSLVGTCSSGAARRSPRGRWSPRTSSRCFRPALMC